MTSKSIRKKIKLEKVVNNILKRDSENRPTSADVKIYRKKIGQCFRTVLPTLLSSHWKLLSLFFFPSPDYNVWVIRVPALWKYEN